ncbi:MULTISPECIES: DinI-like family protein [Citrobacter]|uniref:DinI-like family protein n=1 Tax=Citrobacter TaxID=544 RepID=UPI001BD48E99|nr:DinI-like family protein [Citrobacter portucalensis]
MKVELIIDRTKELPKGVVPALEKELLKCLNDHYDNFRLTIRRAGSDGLSVFGGGKDDIKKIESIHLDTFGSTDEWLVS